MNIAFVQFLNLKRNADPFRENLEIKKQVKEMLERKWYFFCRGFIIDKTNWCQLP